MTFLWPWALAVPAVAIPVLVAAWFIAKRRRRRDTVLFTDVELLETVVPNPAGHRRSLSAAILIVGVLLVLIGGARPAAKVTVASAESTVMLAIDVSLSMEATDFTPDRLTAAESAAKEFVSRAPPEVRIGIVTFAGTARVIVPPTRDRIVLAKALESLQPEQGTAIGEGILASLQATGMGGESRSGDGAGRPSTSILLLSDGENTVGRDPAEAAARARELGVPVSTVAIGTPDGRITVRGTTVRVTVNEEQLREIAVTTRGHFFSASSSADLASVYRNLSREVAREPRIVEVTALFGLAGAAFVIAAAMLSLFWVRNFP